MKTIEINKSFKTHQECAAWEKENLDRIAKENDGVILMVSHAAALGDDEVVLTDIVLV